MRRCCLWLCIVLCLAACDIQGNNNGDTSYFLNNKVFEKQYVSIVEDTVYQVKDEWELAKLLQMRYEKEMNQTYFMCNQELDLNQTSDYLTHVYPFDIQLDVSLETYGVSSDQYQRITMKNLDPYFEDAQAYAEQSIGNIISETMNVAQKVEAIHNYLILHVAYDHSQLIQKDLNSNVFRSYGALAEKKAVCTGYARAFMMYAKLVNIPCILITSTQMDHAWNMIYDGLEWRYVDVTWDDLDDGEIMNAYQNKTKKDFFKDGKHKYDKLENEHFYNTLGFVFFGY